MVRTPGFQPDNRGSIPRSDTKRKTPIIGVFFVLILMKNFKESLSLYHPTNDIIKLIVLFIFTTNKSLTSNKKKGINNEKNSFNFSSIAFDAFDNQLFKR